MSDLEKKEFLEILQLFHRVSLVTESFLLFAKVFLDRLADALVWFLGEPPHRWGSSHAYLFGPRSGFLKICTKRPVVPSTSLTEMGPRLLSRVVDARNDFIEHTGGKSLWGGPLVRQSRAFAVHDIRDAGSFMTSPVYDLDRVLLELREYTAACLAFLQANVDTLAQV